MNSQNFGKQIMYGVVDKKRNILTGSEIAEILAEEELFKDHYCREWYFEFEYDVYVLKEPEGALTVFKDDDRDFDLLPMLFEANKANDLDSAIGLVSSVLYDSNLKMYRNHNGVKK